MAETISSSAPNYSASSTTNVMLRVLEPSNKNRHQAFSLNNVPKFATVVEWKEYIYKNYSVETGAKNTFFTLGYFGEPRNQKYAIVSETQLAQAMSLEKCGWIKLWMDATENSQSDSKRGKRGTSTPTETPQKKSKTKVPADDTEAESELDVRFNSLKKKHPSIEMFKLRVWAKMLVNGTHTSEDEPPAVSFFTGKRAGTSTSTSAQSMNQIQVRGAILKDLRELKELKDAGVLDETQYESQKEKCITQLNNI